jgi:hypothetical protein
MGGVAAPFRSVPAPWACPGKHGGEREGSRRRSCSSLPLASGIRGMTRGLPSGVLTGYRGEGRPMTWLRGQGRLLHQHGRFVADPSHTMDEQRRRAAVLHEPVSSVASSPGISTPRVNLCPRLRFGVLGDGFWTQGIDMCFLASVRRREELMRHHAPLR